MSAASTSSTGGSTRVPWIAGPRFDLAIFFGAAVLALIGPTLVVAGVLSPLAIVWAYVLFFDGPHMMAAYTRTFMDRETRSKRSRLLYGTLAIAVLVPLGSAVLSSVLHRDEPFQLFLGLMTLYSFWHIVRQGWGIFAIYRTRQGDRANVRLERTLFYVAMYAPYIYFLFAHPAVRLTALGPGAAAPLQAVWEIYVARGLIAIGVLAFVLFVVRLVRARATIALYYGASTILFHAIIYFVFSLREPLFTGAQGPDQTFMVITAAVSICHATQYVALVFIHNARRYAKNGSPIHGVAATISAKAWPYVLVCLAFAVPYVGLTWLTGIYPGLGVNHPPIVAPAFTVPRIALAIYWGIALQHYLLDARIWRIKTDPELRRVFVAP